jgi:hypothetical protein
MRCFGWRLVGRSLPHERDNGGVRALVKSNGRIEFYETQWRAHDRYCRERLLSAYYVEHS